MKKLFGSYAFSLGDGIIDSSDHIAILYNLELRSIESDDDSIFFELWLDDECVYTADLVPTDLTQDYNEVYAKFMQDGNYSLSDLDACDRTVALAFLECIWHTAIFQLVKI